MFVLDGLFDHIQQISSNIEIIGSLVQRFAHFRQLTFEVGQAASKYFTERGCILATCGRAARSSPIITPTAPIRADLLFVLSAQGAP
jgi:hypothetical protein